MNFDSKNFRYLGTAALEKAGRRQINFIYFRKTCAEWRMIRKSGSGKVCFILGIVPLDILWVRTLG